MSRQASIVLKLIAQDNSVATSNDAVSIYQKLQNSPDRKDDILQGAFAALIDNNGVIVQFYPPDIMKEPIPVRNGLDNFIKQRKSFALLPVNRKGLAIINGRAWQMTVTPLPGNKQLLIYIGKPLRTVLSQLAYFRKGDGGNGDLESFRFTALSKRWEYLTERRAKAEEINPQKEFFHPAPTPDGRDACLSVVNNLFGQPTIFFKMISPVNVSAIAEKNIWMLSLWMLGINLAVLFITLFLINRQVIKPINQACEIAAASLNEFTSFDCDHELKLDVDHKQGRLKELLELTGKATELYKKSSETANTLFRNVPFGIILYDSDFNIKHINEPAQELLGYKKEELIGHRCNEVFCPAGCVSCPVKSQGCVKNVEMVFLRHDGSPLPVLITGTTIKLHGEEMILEGFVDLTDQDRNRTLMKNYKSQLEKNLTKLQEQNQELQKEAVKREQISQELQIEKEKAEIDDHLKSLFLTNMSYALRTPLNTIIGFANLMTGNATEDERVHYAEVINKSSETLMELISDITDLSKLESGKIEFKLELVEVNSALDSLAEIYQNRLNSEKPDKVKLLVRKSDSGLIMKTDPVRLRQIFSNLLDNAINFTEKGSIEFGIEDVGEKKVTFFVKDTGIGINDNNLKKIFERFSISENQEQKGLCGAGLGLAICMGLVNLMNGKISVDSVPGNGSVFRFELPLNDN